MTKQKINMAVLISGGGRTLQNFIDLSASGFLRANIVGVISSRRDAHGLIRAYKAGLPTAVVEPSDFKNNNVFSRAISDILSEWAPDLITMAGFLSFYTIPPRFENKVMNIHPALLPSFGGHGYYGDKVHAEVLGYGCKVSGCTVHFANNKYDHGPIILQKAVPVEDNDDVHSLAARIFAAETELYPRAVNLYADERLEIEGRRVRVRR